MGAFRPPSFAPNCYLFSHRYFSPHFRCKFLRFLHFARFRAMYIFVPIENLLHFGRFGPTFGFMAKLLLAVALSALFGVAQAGAVVAAMLAWHRTHSIWRTAVAYSVSWGYVWWIGEL